MPEYLFPGIYVEEIAGGPRPIEGVPTSTAGFLGIAERGPLQPTVLTHLGDFGRHYGQQTKVDGLDGFLAEAVAGFFRNGGRRCVVARVVSAAATCATVEAAGWTLTAIGPGDWSSRLHYKIVRTAETPALFTLELVYFHTDPSDISTFDAAQVQHSEVFENLGMDPASDNFVETRVNQISALITIRQSTNSEPATQERLMPFGAGEAGHPLQFTDFIGDASLPHHLRTGLVAFESIDKISILCCPDEHRFYPAIAKELCAQADRMRDRFIILQSELNPEGTLSSLLPSGSGSSYAAFYYPWVRVPDPSTGEVRCVPPGGHIAGVYARTDAERGVHRPPASTPLRGIHSLTAQVSSLEQGLLNANGVNVCRYFGRSGNLVWGARTTSSDPEWKYISIRRLMIYLETSIVRGTQWAVFETNDERTWARVRQSVSDFLLRAWRDGILLGVKPEEAFFVKCDRSTMTEHDIDAGHLVSLVGVAPLRPAEFVIFRVGQWARPCPANGDC